MQDRKKTVLIVDDDEALRSLLSLVVAHSGHDVIVADNGRSARDYLVANPPPAAIVLDLCMPVMSGWEFLDWQSARPPLNSIPIIVYSTETEDPPGFRRPGNLFESVSKMEPARLPKVIARALAGSIVACCGRRRQNAEPR